MIFNVINITVIIAIVRPGCDIVGVVVAGADHPSKAKVAELHHTVLCYQDVLWLHIPDDDDDDVDDDDDYDYGKDNNDDDDDDDYDDDDGKDNHDHDHDDDENLCRQL